MRELVTAPILIYILLLFTQLSLAVEMANMEVSGVQFDLVTIKPGSFLMGSDSGDGDERPVHKVAIDYSFDIGKTEVTVAQFKAFTDATGYKTQAEKFGGVFLCPCPDKLGYDHKVNWQNPNFDQTPDHPATCLSYNDATAFCKWLTEQTGDNYRLPTEAEWEYACRAGSKTDLADNLEQIAWFDMTSPGHPSPVAQKAPNQWGLYDTQGNVAEWCQDRYNFNYTTAPSDGSANTNHDIPVEAAVRCVLRGGSWCRPKTSCTSFFRLPAHPFLRETGTGFRVIRCNRPALAVSAVDKKTHKQTSSENLQAQLKLNIDGIDFDFVRIDPGTFVMGSDSNYIDQYGWKYEFDEHPVTIDYQYYLATTEVTLEQFSLFVDDTGYTTDAEKYGYVFTCMPAGRRWHYEMLADWRFPGYIQTDTEPVTHITWYDAAAFCSWLSKKTNRDIRLPTEAEWEYACRAGTAGYYSGDLDKMSWNWWNCEFRTHPVATKQPNAWGLYDMHGNVWEWVADAWTMDSKDAPNDGSVNLTLPDHDCSGVTRGGSFGNAPWLCRSHTRMRTGMGPRANYNNGFRLAMSVFMTKL